MSELVVLATPAAAPGFRLGGARTVTASDPEQTVAAVDLIVKEGGAAVIAVHAALWGTVPRPVRDDWTKLASPLILALPDEDGDVAAARDAALRDLLARSVGYQITFSPGGTI